MEVEIFARMREIANAVGAGDLDGGMLCLMLIRVSVLTLKLKFAFGVAIEWCVQRRSALRKLDCSLGKWFVDLWEEEKGRVVT